MGLSERSFEQVFERATGLCPFPFQKRLAEDERVADLIEVPTGAGKTAAVILAWLWRRRFAPEHVRKTTPRRLVYCLPMRVLVEQTRDSAILWLHRLGMLAGDAKISTSNGKERIEHYRPSWDDSQRIAVTVLMGGEDGQEWDIYPEQDAIIIGTQDMLLSRALNRGFGMSRYRWPMHFGLLNNDCYWVFDEVQLMGSGLATATQLAAFRSDDVLNAFEPGHCAWMSATLRRDWLETVDFRSRVPDLSSCTLQTDDRNHIDLAKRLWAKKRIEKAVAPATDAGGVADEILDAHGLGTLTLVVLNTVERATSLYRTIEEIIKSQSLSLDKKRRGRKMADSSPDCTFQAKDKPDIVLLHSRFRPGDRERIIRQILTEPPKAGRIVITTQVIEAGVDISAMTLFTEIAPWPSLIQRFGRCNRFGEYEDAIIYWIEIPEDKKANKNTAAPYTQEELGAARKHLQKLDDGSPDSLSTYQNRLSAGDLKELFPYSPRHIVRRKDIIELFDTTPDLAGNDIDVSRFIRDSKDMDVQVFWRNVAPGENPSPDNASGKAPIRGELCPVPFYILSRWIDPGNKSRKQIFRWDYLERKWVRAGKGNIFPGQLFLIFSEEGGYTVSTGWSPDSDARVEPLQESASISRPPEGNDDEPQLPGSWQTIEAHTNEVIRELEGILASVGLPEVSKYGDQIIAAARWHDRGKAHDIFQSALTLNDSQEHGLWAKAPGQGIRIYFNRRLEGNRQIPAHGFRHELASALSMLSADKQDLACYLAAAHHGKVRLSIRSLPNEVHPPNTALRFARGIWDGDQLPITDLGNGVIAQATILSLEAMEMGLAENGNRSWAERILLLRDQLGPFRLAYLETLLRAADSRASAAHARESKPQGGK